MERSATTTKTMLPMNGELGPEERTQIENWFRELGVECCPACQHSGQWWEVGASAVPLPASLPRARPYSFYATVLIICQRCQHMQFHHASAAGLDLDWPA